MSLENQQQFPGFPEKQMRGNFWCCPQILCLYWDQLTGSEFKTLCCVLRHTVGFNRIMDNISLTQLEKGVRNVHSGIGVSRKQIIRSLKSLENKGFIKSDKTGHINQYSLVISVHQKQGTKGNTNSVPMSPETGDKKDKTGVETTHTINNYKKEKNIKRLYEIYCDFIFSGGKLTEKGRLKIEERLDQFHPEELKRSIKNFSENEWNMEKNKHRGPEWFFESESRVCEFLNLNPLPSDYPIYNKDKKENDKELQ